MDIKDMTVEQLGNLCYQEMKRIAQSQHNLKILELRIQELEIEKQKVPEVKDA
jgi:hypothetical protein